LVLTTAGLTGQAHAKGKPFTDPVNVTVNSHPSKVTVEADTETHYPGTSGVSVSGGSH